MEKKVNPGISHVILSLTAMLEEAISPQYPLRIEGSIIPWIKRIILLPIRGDEV